MYGGPIKITNNIIESVENAVFTAVLRQDINVDKDELFKALKYDRDQYTKGYNDALKEFAERLRKIGTEDGAYGYVHLWEVDDLLEEMEVE